MKKVKVGIFIGMVGLLSLYLLVNFLSREGEKKSATVTTATPLEPPARTQAVAISAETAAPPVASVASAGPPQSAAEVAEAGPPVPEQIIRYDDASAVQQRLQQIAKQYATALKYPAYSRPLLETDHALLNPNEFIEVVYPIPGIDAFTYSIVLPHFRLFKPNPIPVTFKIFPKTAEPLPQIHYVTAEIWSEQRRQMQTLLLPEQTTASLHTFTGAFTPSLAESQGWPTELQLMVRFLITGLEEQSVTTVFQYTASVAEILGVEQETVEGSHLKIPLRFKLEKDGYYQVKANLFSQTTGKPIAHLQEYQDLKAPADTLHLKAHIVALKEEQDAGPYVLQDFTILRLPDKPGALTAYVNGQDRTFPIGKHALSEYVDVPYVNPQGQTKLQQFKEFIADPPTGNELP